MSDEPEYLEPAHSIIVKCGGLDRVAEAADVDKSQVCRWRLPKERGGTDGRIPSKRQTMLLEWALNNGIKLGPADFFVAPSARVSSVRREICAA